MRKELSPGLGLTAPSQEHLEGSGVHSWFGEAKSIPWREEKVTRTVSKMQKTEEHSE
jgi:hypothetical protein